MPLPCLGCLQVNFLRGFTTITGRTATTLGRDHCAHLCAGAGSAGVGATLLMRLGAAVTVAVIATIAVSAREVAGRIAKAPAGVGLLRIRAIEVAASAAIVFFGVLLLAGYIATEQLWMFAR
jgi:hypothetical protein